MVRHEKEPRERRRARLVPPVRRARVRVASDDAEARAWAEKLHQKRRRLLVAIGGNALMLLVLVGGPFYRGQERAMASFSAHAAFVSCLFESPTHEPAGISASRDEPERFAQKAFKHDAEWPLRCLPQLARIAPESAIFVLPSVKTAEARVHEASRVLAQELKALTRHEPGMRLSTRPLRALAQLRDSLHILGEVSGLAELPLHTTLVPAARAAPRPAQLPVYVARDAVVSLWGDEQTLYVAGVDRAGVSYLEVQPGHPMRRARLTRPSALAGFVRGREHAFFVWRTPEARCRERAEGCHGKASGIALAPMPLFALPPARYVGAHLSVRPDRGVVLQGGKLYLVATTERGRKTVESTWFDAYATTDPELPPLRTTQSFFGEHDDVLLLDGTFRVWALASDKGTVSLLSESGAQPLASFANDRVPWATACAHNDALYYAAGDGSSLVIGKVRGQVVRTWEPVPFASEHAIDERDPRRDKAIVACHAAGAVTVVSAADGALKAIQCTEESATCRVHTVAPKAQSKAVLPTPSGLLVAYSESVERPQIFVRRLDVARSALYEPVVPAACWEGGRGLCGEPLLAQLGGRVVLGASEGAELLLLESADEGASWSAPPVH